MAHKNQNPRGPHGVNWLFKFTTFLHGFILFCLIVSVCWMVISFPIWGSGLPGIPLMPTVAINPTSELISIAPGDSPLSSLEIDSISADLKIGTNKPWIQWFYLCFIFQIFLLALLYIGLLRKMVGSIAAGEAFSLQNAKRLRWMGALTIFQAVYGPCVSLAFSHWALNKLTAHGGTLMMDWAGGLSIEAFITGWILIILSEVFRQGTAMHEEQSLTI